METRSCLDRARLCGLGEEILVLVVRHASSEQLTDWLKLPLELSTGKVDFLASPSECCHLRRKGEEVLFLVMERASPSQWFKWLQIPLEHAILAGKSLMVETLLAAGGASVRPGNRGDEDTKEKDNDTSSDDGPPIDVIELTAEGGREIERIDRTVSTSCCSALRRCPPPLGLGPEPRTQERAGLSCAETTVALGSCCTPAPEEGVDNSSWLSSSGDRGPPNLLVAASTGQDGRDGTLFPPRSATSGAENEADAPFLNQDPAATASSPGNADSISLHRATMARDLIGMRQLLHGGVDRNATDLWSCTALHRASEQKAAEPVRLLLAAGLDVRARDMEGYSPLHFAAARGAETAIVDLLAAGACLSDQGLNGDSPLHSAVRFLSLATVRILLESDASESALNFAGHTPAEVTGVLPDGREIENQPAPLTAQEINGLLATAPAQRKLRSWKRRAWLVMLRSRAQSMAVAAESMKATDVGLADGEGDLNATGTAEQNTAEAVLPAMPWECCVEGGNSSRDKCDDEAQAEKSGFCSLINQTIGLTEEGVFQKVAGFL